MSQSPTGVPEKLLHELLGTFLVGTWLNTALFAFVLTQIYRYFLLYPLSWRRNRACAPTNINGRRPERAWIPAVVLWMLSMDVTSMFASLAVAYTWTVSGWGDPAILATNAWMLCIYGVAGAMVVVTMHFFLIARFYTLSRRPIVSIFLACLALVACAFGVVSSVAAVTVYRQREDRAKMKIMVGTWLITGVVTDWLIAGTLMWTLVRLRTTVEATQGMISRLIGLSILSGSLTAVLALASCIAFMRSPDTNYTLMFTQSLGHTGTLTVLFNLNSRRSIANTAQGVRAADPPTYDVETSIEPEQLFGGRPGESLSMAPSNIQSTIGRHTRDDGTDFASNGADFGSGGDIDTKATIDFEPPASPRRVHVSGADMGFTRSAPAKLEPPQASR